MSRQIDRRLSSRTGFFLAGSNDGTDVVPLYEDLARMGYVAASMSYRLGIDGVFDLETSLQESVLRGVPRCQSGHPLPEVTCRTGQPLGHRS